LTTAPVATDNRPVTEDVDPPLRIEFYDRQGLRQVALSAPEVIQRSGQALQDAMGIVRQMAERVRQTVVSMPARPSEVEVAFGIKFDAEAGAVIAKTGIEASINVVFRWEHPEQGTISSGQHVAEHRVPDARPAS
jgi:Trypsin-co-occurring domain 1